MYWKVFLNDFLREQESEEYSEGEKRDKEDT